MLWFALLVLGLNFSLKLVSPGLMMYALIFFSLIDLVFPKYGVTLKLLVFFLMIHRVCYLGSFFNLRWLEWLWLDLYSDFAVIAEKGFSPVSLVTAIVLTFSLVIVAQALFSRLLARGIGILSMLFAGVAMLAGAYLWTGNDTTWFIIFYVVLGLLLFGTAKAQVRFSFQLRRWIGISLIWVLALTSIAWALPEANYDLAEWWERALSWEYFHSEEGVPTGKVGYSRFSGNLGGPVEKDDTPALLLKSPRPVYLKGETRYSYTGRTWESVPRVEVEPVEFPFDLPGEKLEVTVEFLAKQGRILFVPGYVTDFQAKEDIRVMATIPSRFPPGGNVFGEYEYRSVPGLEIGDAYTITVILPVDDPTLLRTLSSSEAHHFYYELPDLPERIIELAKEVTADEENGYDKARALVKYLRANWKYSLDTVSPPQDRDFVDWFLFEQDRGYCVHFSTAFVVMARAIGLPARWVKGFTYGERDAKGDFHILNSHAHSWAEVWFDGYGWVPFEPTPGASLPRFETDSEPGPEPNNPLPVDPTDPDRPDVDPGQTPGSGKKLVRNRSTILFIAVFLAVAAVGIGLEMLLGQRSSRSLIALYARLQKRLALFGWQRRYWETPREHLHRVKELPDKPLLTGFVQRYEESAYGGLEDKVNPSEHRLRKKYSLLRLAIHRLFSIR